MPEPDQLKEYKALRRNYAAEDLLRRARRLREHGNLAPACDMFLKAIKIKRQSTSGDEYELLDELGYTYVLMAKYNPARLMFQEAVALIQKNFYAQHFKVAPVLDHWALCYLCMGELEPAGQLIKQSLAIKQKCLLMNDADVLETMRTHAEVDRRLGKYAEAESMLQQAYSLVANSTIGPSEEFLYEFALLYQDQDKFTQSESYYKQAIPIFARRGGKSHRLATVLKSYVQLLRRTGRAKSAASLDAEANALLKHRVPADSPQDTPGILYFERALYPATIMH